MSLSVLHELGIDPESLKWQDLALCKNRDVNNFYDDYESDTTVAKIIDEMCLSCPVMKQCLSEGMENGQWGVWGGIYLVNGKKDDNRNAHKTPEVWEEIRNRLSE